MLLVLLMFSLLMNSSWQQYDAGDPKKNIEFKNRAEFGVFATTFKALHGSYYYYRKLFDQKPTKEQCRTRKINFGTVPYFVTLHPRGQCRYCCPVSSIEKFVTLYWLTKKNNGEIRELPRTLQAEALLKLNFNPNLPTVVYTHGWTEDALGHNSKLILDAYLSRPEEFNIISVDWHDLAAFPWYVNTKENSKPVARVVANFLNFYIKTGEIKVDKLHLIGFSYGAHIVGMIGKYVPNILRITGLDPAVNLYKLNYTEDRLVKSDADYVDILHSDTHFLGFFISIGHADFYPNVDHFDQPGCNFNELTQSKMLELFGTCNHFKATHLYAESVRNPLAFPATRCNLNNNLNTAKKCRLKVDAYMGFPASKGTALGDYYLKTNKRSPFGRPIINSMDLNTSVIQNW